MKFKAFRKMIYNGNGASSQNSQALKKIYETLCINKMKYSEVEALVQMYNIGRAEVLTDYKKYISSK
jgi:hypothetical protein